MYRLDPTDDGSWSITRVTFDTTRPNGLLFSLDHTVLYVAQSGRLPEEKRELRAYPVNDNGSLGEGEVIHDFGAHRGIDGMCLDTEGIIIATAGNLAGGPGPMIYVFSPSGEVIETHVLNVDQPTNCTFGGEDLSTPLRHNRPGTPAQGLHRAAGATAVSSYRLTLSASAPLAIGDRSGSTLLESAPARRANAIVSI